MSNFSVIYDFETLSQDVYTGVAVSLAVLKFDESRFLTKPYDYVDLVDSSIFIKFNVEEQVERWDRKIQKSTLEWWEKQGPEAIKLLTPRSDDISIEMLYEILHDQIKIQNAYRVYTRGNTFDPILLESLLMTFGKEDPTPWWIIRDTRSLFDGMLWGSDISDRFIPDDLDEKTIVKHDPRHDVALDVYRFQHLARLIGKHETLL